MAFRTRDDRTHRDRSGCRCTSRSRSPFPSHKPAEKMGRPPHTSSCAGKDDEDYKRGRSLSWNSNTSKTLSNQTYSRSPSESSSCESYRTPSPKRQSKRLRFDDNVRGTMMEPLDATTMKLAEMLDGVDTFERNQDADTFYHEPLQVVVITLRHRKTHDTYEKRYHAWAFAPEYLFTSSVPLEYSRNCDIVDISLAKPLHGRHPSEVHLDIYFVSNHADVMILRSRGEKFETLRMHEPWVQTRERIYHVDLIDRNFCALFKGRFLPDAAEGSGCRFAESDVDYPDRYCVGAPILLPDGGVVGMNVGRYSDDEIVTVHGLAMVMEKARGRVAINYEAWGIRKHGRHRS